MALDGHFLIYRDDTPYLSLPTINVTREYRTVTKNSNLSEPRTTILNVLVLELVRNQSHEQSSYSSQNVQQNYIKYSWVGTPNLRDLKIVLMNFYRRLYSLIN